MPGTERDEGANIVGWVVAAIVAVVAVCAVTFMVTMRPATAPVVAASQPLRGAQNPGGLKAEIARARADDAARLAQQSASRAQAAASAAAQQAARAVSPATAADAAADASASEPVAPTGPAPLQAPGQ
jgi:hypothetical protein